MKFKNIINKYDKTLNYAEKENKELKTKLKLLLKKKIIICRRNTKNSIKFKR